MAFNSPEIRRWLMGECISGEIYSSVIFSQLRMMVLAGSYTLRIKELGYKGADPLLMFRFR